MKSRTKILLVVFVLATGVVARADILDPVSFIKERTEAVRTLLDKLSSSKTSSEEELLQDKIKNEINNLLDFDELAERAIGSHKQEIGEAKYNEFKALLRELIEKAYTTKIKSNEKFTMEFVKTEVSNGEAYIETIVGASDQKAKIAYRLHKKENRWIAYDFLIEDVSLVAQYKSQFNKIIAQKGFDELMRKMRKKLDELEREESTTTSAVESVGKSAVQ